MVNKKEFRDNMLNYLFYFFINLFNLKKLLTTFPELFHRINHINEEIVKQLTPLSYIMIRDVKSQKTSIISGYITFFISE